MGVQQVFEDRWYQADAVDALTTDIIYSENNNRETHPIAVIQTGAGKSVVLCKVIDEYLSQHPGKDVLVLSHVSKILEQNYERLDSYFGDMFLGLYSAELESKTINKITVAGIQSVHRKADLFQNVGLVIIDECHMINGRKDTGMYRKFLAKLNAVYCGLTATPFRTGQGYIYKEYPGFTPLFNKVSYDLTSYENYNRLIEEGYLSPLVPAPTNYLMDTTGVKKARGDYVESELSAKFNREEITRKIIDQIIGYGKVKYKKWLIFAIDIDHALNIKRILTEKGVSCEAVYSGMTRNKGEVIAEYERGEITALININMLTTGLDIPSIDLVALLRPSTSPIYHVQTIGRGGRPAPLKSHCLVLDYAGNTLTHGPINDIQIIEPTDKKKKGGGVMAKACGNCGTLNSLKAKLCIACETEFTFQEKLKLAASTIDILRTEENLEQWVEVHDVVYSIHQRKGAPSSLRVVYHCGFNQFSEWIKINYSGYWRARALRWTENRFTGSGKFPTRLDELYKARNLLKRPSHILVNLDGKFAEIKDFKWEKGDNLPTERKLFSQKSGAPRTIVGDDDIPF